MTGGASVASLGECRNRRPVESVARSLPWAMSKGESERRRDGDGHRPPLQQNHFKPEHIPIKPQRPLQIRHLKMHMADARDGMNCFRVHALFSCRKRFVGKRARLPATLSIAPSLCRREDASTKRGGYSEVAPSARPR